MSKRNGVWLARGDPVAGFPWGARRATVFELKLLAPENIPAALAKAERYRLLNQPWEAESIYLDVLDIEPDNQEALIGLLLALTDQFPDGLPGGDRQARDVVARMQGEYERAYYAGIICERQAKAQLRQARPGSGSMAYELLLEAKSWYEKAEPLRPPGNDDVLLRWNACARLMLRHRHLAPVAAERYEPYMD